MLLRSIWEVWGECIHNGEGQILVFGGPGFGGVIHKGRGFYFKIWEIRREQMKWGGGLGGGEKGTNKVGQPLRGIFSGKWRIYESREYVHGGCERFYPYPALPPPTFHLPPATHPDSRYKYSASVAVYGLVWLVLVLVHNHVSERSIKNGRIVRMGLNRLTIYHCTCILHTS